jgi:hypothetical protein
VVIGVELSREDYGSITATAIKRGLEPLDTITDPRIRLGGPVGRILVGEKKIIIFLAKTNMLLYFIKYCDIFAS